LQRVESGGAGEEAAIKGEHAEGMRSKPKPLGLDS
jgi:hypothetical protein